MLFPLFCLFGDFFLFRSVPVTFVVVQQGRGRGGGGVVRCSWAPAFKTFKGFVYVPKRVELNWTSSGGRTYFASPSPFEIGKSLPKHKNNERPERERSE